MRRIGLVIKDIPLPTFADWLLYKNNNSCECLGLVYDGLVLARSLVTLFAFVSFFAFTEVESVLVDGKLRALFLRGRR
jgi:hypothetical protein